MCPGNCTYMIYKAASHSHGLTLGDDFYISLYILYLQRTFLWPQKSPVTSQNPSITSTTDRTSISYTLNFGPLISSLVFIPRAFHTSQLPIFPFHNSRWLRHCHNSCYMMVDPSPGGPPPALHCTDSSGSIGLR